MKQKRKLIFQLYPSYLIVILLSLFTVSWYALNYTRQFFLDWTQADLRTQGQLLATQTQRLLFSMDQMDQAAVDRFCKESGKDTPTRITIVLADGTVVGDSKESPDAMDNHRDRPEIQNAFFGKTGVSIRYSETLKQNMMYVALPLYAEKTIGGVIRTSLAVTAIDSQMKLIRKRIALAGFFVALLASGICWYISRRISLPIEKMKRGAEMFADGELDHRLALPDTVELAGLAVTMNQMARQLKKRVEEITRQRNRIEAVLSSMTEGVIATDLEQKVIRINDAASQMFNLPQPHIQGRQIVEVIRHDAFDKCLAATLSTGKIGEVDITVQKEGEIILHIICSPLLGADNRRIGCLVVINDVTRVRQLENVRRDFATNVSHEIKTPLTAIKGFVETLVSGDLESRDDIDHFLGIIEKNVNRLTAVINDLIRLSKIEKRSELNQIELALAKVHNVIANAVGLCSKRMEEKQIKVHVDCKTDLKAKMNSTLLEQACVNLLDNALKYSDENSSVTIEVVQTDGEIQIRFKDQGMGIPARHLPRLFERFYRVDKARSRKLGGTGLGLAIVKHIAQAHKGRVTVDSMPGKGSTFTLHLPLE